MDGNKQRLLVVDDDDMNLDMLARRLERHGYEVERAGNGPQALQFLRFNHVDLVLLDHQMPEITGLEVLRLLRQRHSATELPVIMVTAANDPKTVREAATLGANDFITKPLDMMKLLSRVRSHLGQPGTPA